MRAVLRLVPREVERHVFILVFLRVSAARDPSAAPRTHDERDVFVFACSSLSSPLSSTPFGTVASTRPRSSVSNPPALAATAAAVSSAASSRMARTASSSGLSFCVSTSAVRVGSSLCPRRRGIVARPPREKFVEASRRRVAQALAVSSPRRSVPGPLSSLFSSLFSSSSPRRKIFAMPPFAEGVVAKSDAASPRARARHRRLSLRVEHGDGGVGDGIGRLPRRVDRFSAFGVGDGDGVGRLPRLVALPPPVFSVKKVVADRATAFAARLGNPKLLLRISVSCPTRPAFQSRRCVVLSWARYSSLSSFGRVAIAVDPRRVSRRVRARAREAIDARARSVRDGGE